MDFDRLYEMGHIGRRRALHVEPRELERIPDGYALYGGEVRPDRPLIFDFKKGASGSTAYDFVGTTLPPLKLISDRVVEVLRSFSGWSTYPVEVYGKKGERIPGYHGLSITGRCGPIDDSRSQPRIRPPASPAGRATREWIGLYFDPATWDGSDLFLPRGSGGTFVTEAVKTALERARITNVQFTPLTEALNMSSALLFGAPHRSVSEARLRDSR